MALFLLPAFFVDQIGVHGPIFVGLFHVEVAGLDGRGDSLEQKNLVERYTETYHPRGQVSPFALH